MDSMSYRNNRPTPQRSEQQEASAPAAAASVPVQAPARGKSAHSEPKRRRKLPIIIAIVVLIVIAAAAYMLLGRGGAGSAIDTSKYQAVFFTNGQVYFGKLSELNGDYMRLENVYYLQNKEQAADETSPQAASAQDANDVELIKLGNEIHGPEDEMLVSKDQVLFFENLKPTGTVSKTISDFQKNN